MQRLQNIHAGISCYKNTTCAISSTNFDLRLVFILGKNTNTGPNIFFPVYSSTFPSLTTCRLIILCYFWLSSEFYLLGLYIPFCQESSVGKGLIIELALSRIPEFISFVSFYALLKSLKFSFLSLLFLLCICHHKVHISP
jgi:hypothetical protein